MRYLGSCSIPFASVLHCTEFEITTHAVANVFMRCIKAGATGLCSNRRLRTTRRRDPRLVPTEKERSPNSNESLRWQICAPVVATQEQSYGGKRRSGDSAHGVLHTCFSDAAKAMLTELTRQIHLLYSRSSHWELAQVPATTGWNISPKMHFFIHLMECQVLECSHKQATKIPARTSPSTTVHLFAKEMLNPCQRRPGWQPGTSTTLSLTKYLLLEPHED